MDIIDNIMFASRNLPNQPRVEIQSDYLENGLGFNLPDVIRSVNGSTVYSYSRDERVNFCAYPDTSVIERTITRHWYDISNRVPYNYESNLISNFEHSSNYHLIYAYLVENTRIIQIFERVIERYFQDEEFGIAEDPTAFNWIANSEKLFFKNDSPRITNTRSLLRPSSDATRRNAYQRMFGIDLAFGNSINNGPVDFYRAKASNQQFIPLFERFLSEIWQGYINSRNTSGPNTTDVNIINDLAIELNEMLMARRGSNSSTPYMNRNLSREEFAAVLICSWFTFIISYDSPIVEFLGCESSTISERLAKIGDRVGLKPHTKCQSLFEMAGPAANILCGLEAIDPSINNNVFSDPTWVTGMLSSLNPNPAQPPSSVQAHFMTDFLMVINNWEKATGRRIKQTEKNITTVIRNGIPKTMNLLG